MPPCLTLSIIRYRSKVKWRNSGKVSPTPTPRCSSFWKGSLRVALEYGHQLYIYVCICIFFYSCFLRVFAHSYISIFLSNTNNLYTLMWFQVFLSNTNNLYTIIWFQVFLSNTNNLYTIIWFQVFLSNTNNLYTIIWFQVFLSNTNNHMVLSNYFYLIILCWYTVIWFQVRYNNP